MFAAFAVQVGLFLLVLALALVDARIGSGLMRHSDSAGIEDFCPFSGNVKTVRRAANRLMYEGKIVLAQACYAKALNVAFDPDGVLGEDSEYPLPRFDDTQLFRRSAHLIPEDFDTLELLSSHLHVRTMKSLKTQHMPGAKMVKEAIKEAPKPEQARSTAPAASTAAASGAAAATTSPASAVPAAP